MGEVFKRVLIIIGVVVFVVIVSAANIPPSTESFRSARAGCDQPYHVEELLIPGAGLSRLRQAIDKLVTQSRNIDDVIRVTFLPATHPPHSHVVATALGVTLPATMTFRLNDALGLSSSHQTFTCVSVRSHGTWWRRLQRCDDKKYEYLVRATVCFIRDGKRHGPCIYVECFVKDGGNDIDRVTHVRLLNDIISEFDAVQAQAFASSK